MPFELKDGILYVPRNELLEVILTGNSRSYAGGGERVYKPTGRGTFSFKIPSEEYQFKPPLSGYVFQDEFWGDSIFWFFDCQN